MKKIFALITIFILNLSLFANGVKTPEVGEQFPNLTFITMEGKKVSLDSMKGKNILINFTASWCPFCKEEKIKFKEDYSKFLKDRKDLEVLVVFGDYGRETKEAVKNYMEENSYSFPIYYDQEKAIAKEIGLSKIPFNYFLDETGKIVETKTYYYEIEALKPLLKK
ncbi:MAG: TlpA family protein disulfide reductase [Fusobacteriaceae bacterium]